MVKIGLNKPCPCGSGKKYKKCCRKQKKVTASGPNSGVHKNSVDSGSVTKADSPDQTCKWLPITKKYPNRLLTSKETNKLLNSEQRKFFGILLDCADPPNLKNARKGLKLIEQIPEYDLVRLNMFFDLKITFLSLLGRADETFETAFRHAIQMNDKEMWMVQGRICYEWMRQNYGRKLWYQAVEKLEQIVSEGTFIIPMVLLIVAYKNDSKNSSELLMPLYEVALDRKYWNTSSFAICLYLDILSLLYTDYFFMLTKKDEYSKAIRYAKMMVKFPWEKDREAVHESDAERVCSSLFKLEMFKDLSLLCERILKYSPTWVSVHYWLGMSARKQGQHDLHIKHFKNAIKKPGCIDDALLNIANSFIQEENQIDLKTTLSYVKDKERLGYLEWAMDLAQIENEPKKALDYCNQILAQTPDDEWFIVIKYTLLEYLNKCDELAEILEQPLTDDNSEEIHSPHLKDNRISTRIFTGRILCRKNEYKKALKVLEPIITESSEADKSNFKFIFCDSYSECLKGLSRYDEAIKYCREALEIRDSERVWTRLILTLALNKQFEEASAESVKALEIFPETSQIISLHYLILSYLCQYKKCLEFIDDKGETWFKENNLHKDYLKYKIKMLAYLDRPFEALEFCEPYLEIIIADKELKEQRDKVFKFLRQLFDQEIKTREKKGQKLNPEKTAKTLEKLEKEHENLKRELEASTITHENLRSRVTHLRDKVDKFQDEKSRNKLLATTHKQRIKQEYPNMKDQYRQMLVSAEVLWEKLKRYPNQDHSPIVLQLSRAVEGEVNRLLINPLVQVNKSYKNNAALLSSVIKGKVLTKNNRLSLGEASRILYSRLEEPRPDGSKILKINPYSNEAHQKLLDTFHQLPRFTALPKKVRYYLLYRLPMELEKIAGIRNMASHGTRPFNRIEITQVREQILNNKNGLLGQLMFISL